MLTPEDEQLITRAVVMALAKWSAICFLIGVAVGLIWVIISSGGGE